MNTNSEITYWEEYAEERKVLAKWLLKNDFDTWSEVELDYEKTKHLKVAEKKQLLEDILLKSTNIMNRVFYGNKANRKNEKGTQFTFLHLGKTNTNPHFHILTNSDKRVSIDTYRGLLTLVLRYLFEETTDKCGAFALKKEKENVARYATHEFYKLKTETIHSKGTHIGNNNYNTEFNNDIQRRIKKLKLKILRKALKAYEKQYNA